MEPFVCSSSQKMGLNPHGQPLPTGCEFDAKLMPNPAQNTGLPSLLTIKPFRMCVRLVDPTIPEGDSSLIGGGFTVRIALREGT